MNEQGGSPVDLRQYLGVLKTRKWTIVLTTLLVVGVALLVSFRQTPRYEAEARLLVKPIPTGEGFQITPNLLTEGELVQSEPVARLVAADLGSSLAPSDLLRSLSVDSIPTSEVLILTYNSTDPAIAQAAADSFATNYIAYKQETARRSLGVVQEAIERQLNRALRNLTRVAEALREARAAKDRVQAPTLEAQRAQLTTRIGLLQQRLDDLNPDLAISLGGGEVIEPAELPVEPSSPNPLRDGAAAMVFGLLLGTGAAFLRDRLDDRFRGRADVERTIDAPVLATVPRFRTRRRQKGDPSDLVVVTEPKGAASEAYRTLRTNLQFTAREGHLKAILLTSSTSGEGKTVTAANLAVALSQAGRRVILLSADLRRPTLERYFGLRKGAGLTSWLLGEVPDLWPLFRSSGHRNLRILPSGPTPSNPAELLASPKMPELIELVREHCDFLLIDTTPALGLADAVITSGYADAVLLLIDASTAHRSAVNHVRQALEHTGSPIIGAVLNAVDTSSSAYYGYGAYYNTYYPDDPRPEERNRPGETRKKRLRAL